ncbi:MAG: ATPase [Erythrobacter sp.]
MSGKKHIIRAINRDEEATIETAVGDTAIAAEDISQPLELKEEVFEEAEAAPSRFGWIAPVFAVIAVAAWSALYVWAMRNELANASAAAPSEWVRWIIDWSVPVLLVGVIWLIAMRNSAREANRFAATAALLSQESAELENRLTVVNRELSLAREFLGSQSRELESLGRMAAERISTHASELQDLIQSNGAQVDAIGTASDTALANMTRLRDDLPVVANSARDVNNQVGNTGRTAREQLDKLVAGFERLNEFGSASENQVSGLSKRIGDTIGVFEAQLQRIESTLATRFETLQAEAETYRGKITETEALALNGMNERITLLQTEARAVGIKMRDAEAQAMTQIRETAANWEIEIAEMVGRLSGLDQQAAQASQQRIQALNDEAGRFDDRLHQRDVRFMEEMARRQSEFDTREAQATEVLSQRLGQLDEAMAERREAQLAETEKLVAQGETMGQQLAQLRELIADIQKQGETTQTGLSKGMDTLAAQLDAKRQSLIETEANLSSLTEASIRLLEIIQSGARHSREDLPEAIKSAAEELAAVEERASGLSGAMIAIGQKGEDLSAYLIKTNEEVTQADQSIAALQTRMAEQSEEALAKLNGLRTGLSALSEESETFAGETQEKLAAAIAELEQGTRSALAAMDEGAQEKVTELAHKLSNDAVSALERALSSDTAETIGKLEQAAALATGTGREATIQLRNQLARVNELTGNLEQRVARARELAEEQIDNDFARRMALITDSLNSAAIDISGAISAEVTDTAWESYLKGDRGIFTRRAVRLLDNSEAREIAELYQSDKAFHDNVSRYIHDFEAMLRAMLSTRDGNALSVTVLGSDMGKLYVALAQGIERLRN